VQGVGATSGLVVTTTVSVKVIGSTTTGQPPVQPIINGPPEFFLSPAWVFGVVAGQTIPTTATGSSSTMFPAKIASLKDVSSDDVTFATNGSTRNLTVNALPPNGYLVEDIVVVSGGTYPKQLTAHQIISASNVVMPIGTTNFALSLLKTTQSIYQGSNDNNVLYVRCAAGSSGVITLLVTNSAGTTVTGLPTSVAVAANQILALPFNVSLAQNNDTLPGLVTIQGTLSSETHVVPDVILANPNQGGTSTTVNPLQGSPAGQGSATSRYRHPSLGR
jgi:hypothetical protein